MKKANCFHLGHHYDIKTFNVFLYKTYSADKQRKNSKASQRKQFNNNNKTCKGTAIGKNISYVGDSYVSNMISCNLRVQHLQLNLYHLTANGN